MTYARTMPGAALIIIALLAPFFFAWHFSILLAFGISLFMPFIGIATGIIADAIYYTLSQQAAACRGLRSSRSSPPSSRMACVPSPRRVS